MDVRQREAMQRGAELKRFTFAHFCVASRWLTSLSRKAGRAQRSLAIEVNNALRMFGLDCLVLHCKLYST